MLTDADVAEVRHVVQKILVPCIFLIGLLGNSISIYVLTRKRMRCSTNIYLTALAITDIFYLLMALMLSLKHYTIIQQKSELYWICYGWIVWLCDACAYISIYIAVCFTIERFVAIRYPLKRQTFCTELLAKKVICGVVFFCLLTTLSTAFEHQYHVEFQWIDQFGKPCRVGSDTFIQNATTEGENNWFNKYPGENTGPKEEPHSLNSGFQLTISSNLYLHTTEYPKTKKREAQSSALALVLHQTNSADIDYSNLPDVCYNVTLYKNGYSTLAENVLYKRVWYSFTLFIFVVIPLCVLCTFNCFLIILVRRSKHLRREMTNVNSIRRSVYHKNKVHVSTMRQENRITITLIAVVLLFIICQLPWAIYLIVLEYVAIDLNTQKVFGNICNFLAGVNAAANFFLYCVLSDKYRKSVRQLISVKYYRRDTFANTNPSFNNNTQIKENTQL